MKKTTVLFLCACLLLTACWAYEPAWAAMTPAGEDGFFSGVVQEGKFYHDGRDAWISFYFVDVGKAQLDKLIKELGEAYYDSGEYEIKSEIHIYTTDKKINLKDNVGKKISFKGAFFEAQTMNHRRDIVFELKEMFVDSE
jgi:hypothetical protein